MLLGKRSDFIEGREVCPDPSFAEPLVELVDRRCVVIHDLLDINSLPALLKVLLGSCFPASDG